jgi:hypothetical protein
MTKRDEAVFAKAFEKMKAKGYFDELQAKSKTNTNGKTMPVISKIGRKSRQQKVTASISSRNVANKTPLAASKK